MANPIAQTPPRSSRSEAGVDAGPPRAAIVGLVVLQFLIWSNSFVAIAYLLGREGVAAGFDWVTLTVARFAVAGAVSLAYCLLFRRREAAEIIRRRWRRLIVCGVLSVPIYNLSLYYGQQHGVAAPVASLITALLPLFVLLLSVAFLGERQTTRHWIGFVVATFGLYLVATARGAELEIRYPVLVAVTALAPLSWSIYTILSKPVAGEVSPVVWTLLTNVFGTVTVLPWLPGATWPRLTALDGWGWFALLYLALLCTVGGYAVWVWLLRYLPASAVGFTVFLNPPFTAISKLVLATALPAVFTFVSVPREWLGGALALVGMAIAIGAGRRRAAKP